MNLFQNQIMLQNFLKNSSTAYVPPEIEQQNRIDKYNELTGMLNPYYQQELYNMKRQKNMEFSKKMQAIYDKQNEDFEQKQRKYELDKLNYEEQIRKYYEHRQELLEAEKHKILYGTENDLVEGITTRKFTRFITHNRVPYSKIVFYKKLATETEIEVDEKYAKKERDISTFDWDKFKANPHYQYQIANYCNKQTIVFYPDEQWVPLYDIPDIYMISNYGRLYNKRLRFLVRPAYRYYHACYHIYYPGIVVAPDRREYRSISRSVLQSFCPIDDPEQYRVVYKDGNVYNFHLSNLKWQSKKDIEIKKHKKKKEVNNMNVQMTNEIPVYAEKSEQEKEFDHKIQDLKEIPKIAKISDDPQKTIHVKSSSTKIDPEVIKSINDSMNSK